MTSCLQLGCKKFTDWFMEWSETILLISSVASDSPSVECKKEDGCYRSTRITIVDNDDKLAYPNHMVVCLHN